MKKFLLALTLSALSSLLFVSLASASGFRLPESSASAMGMASAFVAQADDASAVWYNPAGITQLDGTWIAGGTVAIYPSMKHENTTINPGTTDVSERMVHLPIHLFGTHKLDDKISFGFGITNPFGLSTDWDPTNASTKYVATYTKLVTENYNPNVAYKFNNNLTFAVGVNYVRIRAVIEKKVFVVVTDDNFRLKGDGDGWGVNAATLYKVSDQLNLGLSYRSRMKTDVRGNAELTGTGAPAPQYGSGSTFITLPDILQFGASYKPSEKVTINADLEYTWWSTYDRLVVESNNITFIDTDEKQWDNTWVLRLGGQYKPSKDWAVRAGYIYDQSPVPEEYFETRVPDSDRQGISVGAGHTVGNLTIDVAYMYLKFKNRTVNNSTADDAAATPAAPEALDGNYKTTAHLAGITVGYKF